jgi:predicted nicotinamide N-methyase
MPLDESSRRLIVAGARLGPVPLVPEIRLHQATDPISLWQRTEEASGRTGLDPPFWAFAWAAGQALARYLLDHPQTARGRDVIDIASGSGLVAIAAAMAGAAVVTAYDIDPLATEAIEVNAAANDVTVRAVCADVLDRDDLPPPGTGLVLVADAFYQRDLAARVMGFASRSHARGAVVLAADFGRAYLPRDRLTPLASYDVPGQRVTEDSDTKRTTIWSLAERPGKSPAPPSAEPALASPEPPRPNLWHPRLPAGPFRNSPSQSGGLRATNPNSSPK